MSAKQNVIEEALRLTEDERLEVAEALYESLEGPADPDVEAAWAAEIERRVKSIDVDRLKTISWSEVRQQIIE
jgi:putative addiction module component (TIGR02574 family)